jgi:hypothetical protein
LLLRVFTFDHLLDLNVLNVLNEPLICDMLIHLSDFSPFGFNTGKF